jgi:undecaprenyl-diphosphatase
LTELHDVRWAWDEAFFHRLNGGPSAMLDAAALMASSHEFCFGVAALAAIFVLIRRRLAGVPWILAGVCAVAAADFVGARLLKPWFARLRPCYALAPSHVAVLEHAGNSGSMPSLHAATAFAAATVLSLERPKLGPLYFSIAALIGWSRIREGVHWPTDVAAGALFGIVVGALTATVLLVLHVSRQPGSFPRATARRARS